MASSRSIVAGEEYTPDDINNLRNDVLDPVGGHKHNGVDGAKVPFSNLDVSGASGSTAPTGGAKSYNDLANHVASSAGQHALNAAVHVIGTSAAAMMILSGTGTWANPSGNLVTCTITFSPVFTAAPIVVVTPKGAAPSPSGDVYPHVFSAGVGSAVIKAHNNANGCSFNWIAIGVKAA